MTSLTQRQGWSAVPHEAIKRGDVRMPRGVLGMFARMQLAEIANNFPELGLVYNSGDRRTSWSVRPAPRPDRNQVERTTLEE